MDGWSLGSLVVLCQQILIEMCGRVLFFFPPVSVSSVSMSKAYETS